MTVVTGSARTATAIANVAAAAITAMVCTEATAP